MTVAFLTKQLKPDTFIIIKDHKTKKTLWDGDAEQGDFDDTVLDWDFRVEHIIYI